MALANMTIVPGDLDDAEVVALVHLHLAAAHANSPPGSVFALDLSGLKVPEISFFVVRVGDRVAGMGAIKALDEGTGELKSMRVHPDFLGKGVGRSILVHLLEVARGRGYKRVSLETGSGLAFEAALGLYRAHGFTNGPTFGDYTKSAFNQFMHLDL
jgi:putative acetyltransferase